MVGGQAVLEGVMMRVPGYYATAVRNPKGEIKIKREKYLPLVERLKLSKFPWKEFISTYSSIIATFT